MARQKSNFRIFQRDMIRLLPLLKRKGKRLKRNFKRTKRTLQALGAREALVIGLQFTHGQIIIRPRARLVTKLVVVLALLLAVASPLALYLEHRKADIKIGGHAILVAQEAPGPSGTETNIDQEVSAHKSPFEFSRPIEVGYISQGFSGYHPANDIAGPLGEPVHPIGVGTVEFAGMVYDGHGNMIIIDNGDGLKSTYSHLGTINVGVGNRVNGKTQIGTVGLTGRTTGPHVHMEIIDNGIFVDPSKILTDLK
jgi:murein DD-endopeptidase MepM/ murein hydrolase activator NlpD